jgi:biotin synthase-like enzyme
MIQRCIQIIKNGDKLDFSQAMELAQKASLTDLCKAANKLCRDIHGARFDLCSIINARSGKCTEDCHYCAQSVHHNTDIKTYEQIASQAAVDQARENDAYGVSRLSLVTAGRSLNSSQINSMG